MQCSCHQELVPTPHFLKVTPHFLRGVVRPLVVVVVVVISSSHQSPSLGVSLFPTVLSITILMLVWSALKGSQNGGGCHEATDHSCGNGCALSCLFHSCTDQGFDCDRCAVVPE